ncbi:hypothetical protein GCM10025768_13810 [Microbacterium pseudoresistens]|uniref:AraC-like DNA-binding protein n=1 Tax=Microbacterium pseudoresistens TaxID=640634 RepID=A0A7Y9ESR8_9MICO|nr:MULTISPECIES: AraC family transcriptional regulator [Microbacterium]MBY6062610.1 AraC family transcriptional regulator [Microbacterium esteraromaticum]NYD53265.1 AraC-like DNA-binding protein [Microbacterium pseudoresistens]
MRRFAATREDSFEARHDLPLPPPLGVTLSYPAIQIPGDIAAIEMVRTIPSSRTVFRHVKVINVVEGSCAFETAESMHILRPGMSLALGTGKWCRVWPAPTARIWAIYADEQFWRTQMAWFLPDADRVLRGVHPLEWDGRAIVLAPGVATLQQAEPLWRQMSVIRSKAESPEVVATHTLELLARWMRLVLPTFLNAAPATPPAPWTPISGRLTDTGSIGYIGRAIQLLRRRIAEPWTIAALSRELSLSRTHLTRLFVQHAGAAPMRLLTELRLTEFTRLIEETDLSVMRAANDVGWNDPRVASHWFRRRYGTTPTQYRRTPHTVAED